MHFSYTIAQADAGLLGIDVKENAFIANFGLGSQADQAAEIRISRPRRSGSFCCCHGFKVSVSSSRVEESRHRVGKACKESLTKPYFMSATGQN